MNKICNYWVPILPHKHTHNVYTINLHIKPHHGFRGSGGCEHSPQIYHFILLTSRDICINITYQIWLDVCIYNIYNLCTQNNAYSTDQFTTCGGKQVVWNTRPRHHSEAEMRRAQTASTEMEFMWHLNTSHGWPQGRICASLSAANVSLIPVHFCPLLAGCGQFGRSPLAPWLMCLWVATSHAWLLLQQVGMSSKWKLGWALLTTWSIWRDVSRQRCLRSV